ncbi:glycerate kinase [Terribacillus sp. JSM ZJ617]|uniref:glycerate kinase n=1 Tax=Terribacillus sp. JSM ZJ617 TaxID=3342119 RepID=UPI0035A8925C
MKILIAIDSFKGSVSSKEGSEAIALGVKDVYPEAEILSLPLADGGEGTIEALVQATEGNIVEKEVIGPLRNKVTAKYGILSDKRTAVIEVAEACGLPLVPYNQRNPLITTSYGVGELILDALDNGCRKFVIGLGGSATNDGGVGMLRALGFRFLNKHGEEVGIDGKALIEVRKIDLARIDNRLKECEFKVACDVNNPLCGPKGASYIFGPQKGATTQMVEELDKGLKHFADIVFQELGKDIHNKPGTGAAGGLGAACLGFLNATLKSGIDLILETLEMEKYLHNANFVITGEGKLDGQTSMGKAPLGIAQLASEFKIPVLALAGGVTEETAVLNELGVTSYFSIVNAPMELEEAMDSKVTYNNLRVTTNQLFRLIKSVDA